MHILKKESLNGFIFKKVKNFLESKNIQLKIIDLYKDKFNPCLDFKTNNSLVKKYQEKINWTEQIIFIYSIWWENTPAILKGFFDKVLTSGFAYKFFDKKIPIKLLKEKKVILIRTFGGPKIYSLIVGRGSLRNPKITTLGFVGIKIDEVIDFYGVNYLKPSEEKIKNFIEKIKKKLKIIIKTNLIIIILKKNFFKEMIYKIT